MNAKNIIIAVLFLSGIFAAGEAWSMAQRHKAVHEVYSCPMHPQIKSDKPGQCPICGMDLVKQGSNTQGHACSCCGLKKHG